MNPRWGSGHLRGKVIELLVNIDDDILVGGLVVGKTMGKPWENHGKMVIYIVIDGLVGGDWNMTGL